MKYILLLISLLTILTGCKKSEQILILKDPSLLRIDAGFACGWGIGSDSLIITRSSIKYLYWIPRESLQPKINKSISVSDSEWSSITNSVNLYNFKLLNYNSCFICADGCDEWIAIKTDQFSHQIRFAKGFKIDSIKPLQDKLEQLRIELGN